MTISKRLFVLLCISVSLVGCATPPRKVAMRDLANLPRSEGSYGGKIWIDSPWLYCGSDDSFHYFLYTYTTGNNPHSKRLKIPRAELRLAFEFRFIGYDKAGIAVTPLYGFGSGIYDFARTPSPNPQVPDWNGESRPLPSFDQKLPPAPKVEALTTP